MPSIDKLCDRMRYWCDDANLGYCQEHRWNIYEGGEADCSSLVIHCLQEAGFDTGSASYTGDMSENLTARGWARVANDGNPKRGDVLLNDTHHVAVYIGDGLLCQASRNENHGANGGQPGDQDGWETNTRGYYNYPWDCYLRYPGTADDSSETPSEPSNAAALECDGIWGPATTSALQAHFGTPVDGEIWHQWPDNKRYLAGCCDGWRYDYTGEGSPLIRAMQDDLGVETDGLMGPDTVNALIKHLCTFSGADCFDGKLDCPSITIKAMQARLNQGEF